ncbi:MAG TPA: chromosomal replication initiator protein DnaA [Gemmataceae bacterium]|jgi:chromosomal replication initiator protein|nr:chromosomal replication initiator protein DnaA [Gemmataceae bacterium]
MRYGGSQVITCDRQVVATLGREIARRIGEPRYNLWFGKNTKFTWDSDVLTVGVPNHFFQEWLQNKFGEAVRHAACEILERPMMVRFVIDPDLFQAARRSQNPNLNPDRADGIGAAETAGPGPKKQLVNNQSSSQTRSRSKPNPGKRTRHWRRLADFVVGPCNRVAYASALSVVEAAGQHANPLVFHGPVGTGKTHLLEGIYAGLRKNHSDWRICYVTSEDFTNRFIQAMRLGKIGSFRHYFRECDVLLIDDLNFLAKKRATQEEFLHTFDALQPGGKQLVITCDCHPKLADELTPELIDRLLGGAVWSLSPPDLESRIAILRTKAAKMDLPLSDEVLRLVAEKLQGNVRELEGSVHSLRHYSHLAGRPVDLSMTREALAELFRHSVRVLQLADVDGAICLAFRLGKGALQSRERSWAVSHPRMMAMYLARKHTAAAYSEIGTYFGGRNHSTAVAAEKKIRRLMEQDGELTLGDRRLRIREVIAVAERELLK